VLFAAVCASPQSWRQRVTVTQAQQPHWINPLATTTGRLEQGFRFDVQHQHTGTGGVNNLGSGKGFKLIPAPRIELQLNLPPYLSHENPTVKDGWSDVSFNLKYRFLARPEKKGNLIFTGFMGGSAPTGQYKNGSTAASLIPTLAAGKGWGWFDVQSTLAGNLPVENVKTIGRAIVWNTAFQGHVLKRLWPEVEVNSTSWAGGAHDGKKQAFLTPGIVIGRFPMDKRVAFAFGGGFQVAATRYHASNHNTLLTFRVRF
jgi:hypothetical protein